MITGQEKFNLFFLFMTVSAIKNLSISSYFRSPIIKTAVKNLGPTLLQMSSAMDKDARDIPSPTHSHNGSTDGSTTVSATSSPGIDQQEQEEMNSMTINRIPEMAYKTSDDIYHTPVAVAQAPLHFQQQNSTSSSSNGNEEIAPRKRARKQQM